MRSARTIGAGAGGRRSIAHELRRLILYAAVPFVSIAAALAWLDYTDARAEAEAYVVRQAKRAALDVENIIREAGRGLRVVASLAGVRAMDPAKCPPEFGDIIAMHSRYANVLIADVEGGVVCAAVRPAAPDREWLRAAAAARGVSVGPVIPGVPSGSWVARIAMPVLAPDGASVGAVALELQLAAWEPPGGGAVVPEGTVIGVLDGTVRVALRFPDPGAWVGRDVGGTETGAALKSLGTGLITMRGLQGRDRIWAGAPIAGTDWNAYAGMLNDRVLAAPLRRTVFIAALVGVALLVGAWLAWMVAGRLALPIVGIARSARERTAGIDVPVPVAGPSEVIEVAEALNRMIATQQESEARVRRILDNAPDLVYVNRGDRIRYVNPAGVRLLRAAGEDDLLGLSVYDIFHPDDHALVRERIARLRADPGMAVASSPERLLALDGTVIDAEVSAASYAGEDGIDIEVVCRDVTARRLAEAALRASEERFSAVFEASPVGIAISGLEDGSLIDANDAALRLWGCSREEALGRTPEELGLLAEPAQIERSLPRLRESGRIDGLEVNLRTRDGSITPLALSARVVPIGGRDCIVATLTDLTERRRLEQASLRSQKLESLGTLAGGIAHDFNNILAAIRGNADLAAEDIGPGHPAAESLAEIRKAGARGAELVRRITAFGRPHEPRHAVIELGGVIEEVLKLLRSTLPATIALRTRVGPAVPPVQADAAQVHEALVNLTTNAAHAIGPRAGSIDYGLEAFDADEAAGARLGIAPGRYARVAVRDSGCGMDEATIARIFDAFYTTKPQGEGTGLGLSMVYGIMQASGGTVAVESAPGRGSTFSLYFPAARSEPDGSASVNGAGKAQSPGLRILFVDDEEALVSLAGRVLGRRGHRVNGFTDPKEALEAFAAAPDDFDLVVTDLAMPGLSGIDLARELLARRPGLPVFLCTGNAGPGDEVAAREAGIRQVVAKPATVQELADFLEAVFRGEGAAGRPRS